MSWARQRLQNLQMRVVEDWSRTEDIPNVLMVSGHNDSELVRYLEDLGEKGLLRDRVLLLNTCYANGNTDLFHELIQAYGARAILLQEHRINPLALSETLVRAAEQLGESDSGIRPESLLRDAAQSLLDSSEDFKPEVREGLEQLLDSLLQVSQRIQSPSHRDTRLRQLLAARP